MKMEPISTPRGQRHLRDVPIYRPGRPIVGATQGFLEEPLTFHIEPYRRWGSAFRMRYFRNMHLVLTGPEANDFVWRNAQLWSYSTRMKLFSEGFDEHCVLQLDGLPQRKKHRRLAQGFRMADLVAHAPVLERIVADTLSSLPDGRADLREVSKYLTIAMTYWAMLQAELPVDMDRLSIAYSENMLFGNVLGPFRKVWNKRPTYRRIQHDLFALANQTLNEREANPPNADDALSLMIKAHPADESPLTRQEIVNDLLFLLQGGTQTASNLITWAVLYLYHDPAWLAEVREELQNWRPEQFQDMEHWPKLAATILELERLRPPVPLFIYSASRDFTYQDITVPKGTLIFHQAALPHVLPELYPDPLSFKPQRFVGDGKCPHKAHSTYGGGAHFCLGQPLARLKMMLTLAHIVKHYDIEFGFTPSFRPAMGVTLTPVEPALPIRFVARRDMV